MSFVDTETICICWQWEHLCVWSSTDVLELVIRRWMFALKQRYCVSLMLTTMRQFVIEISVITMMRQWCPLVCWAAGAKVCWSAGARVCWVSGNFGYSLRRKLEFCKVALSLCGDRGLWVALGDTKQYGHRGHQLESTTLFKQARYCELHRDWGPLSGVW